MAVSRARMPSNIRWTTALTAATSAGDAAGLVAGVPGPLDAAGATFPAQDVASATVRHTNRKPRGPRMGWLPGESAVGDRKKNPHPGWCKRQGASGLLAHPRGPTTRAFAST